MTLQSDMIDGEFGAVFEKRPRSVLGASIFEECEALSRNYCRILDVRGRNLRILRSRLKHAGIGGLLDEFTGRPHSRECQLPLLVAPKVHIVKATIKIWKIEGDMFVPAKGVKRVEFMTKSLY